MYTKQKLEDGQVFTAAHLAHVEDGILDTIGRYYTSLQQAVADANAGVTTGAAADATDAVVWANIGDMKATLTLLQDVEESGQIEVSTNMELILNGHTLSMNYAGDNITVAAGASLFIDGTRDGSAITVEADADAAVNKAAVVRSYGTLHVCYGRYSVAGPIKAAMAFAAEAGSPKMVVEDCTVNVTSSNSTSSIGFQSLASIMKLHNIQLTIDGSTVVVAQYMYEADISKLVIEANAVNQCSGLIAFPGSDTTVKDLNISCTSTTANVFAFRARDGASVTASGLQITAEAKDGQAYGMTVDAGASVTASELKITTAVAGGETCGLWAKEGTTVTVDGLQITAEASTGEATGVLISEGAAFTAKGLNLSAVTKAEAADNKDSCGVTNGGNCTIEDAVILADAKGAHAEVSQGIGINSISTGTLICKNSLVAGTHSGIQNAGNLYIDRCLLGSVSHGGLYTTHTHDKEAVVNDTVLEGGVYRGQLTDVYASLFGAVPYHSGAYSAMYFGSSDLSNDGGDLYMDGCIFVGVATESFVVRPAGIAEDKTVIEGTNPNRLFISRSKIAVQLNTSDISRRGEIAPIRLSLANNYLEHDKRSTIDIGLGCNFTAENLTYTSVADHVTVSDVLYREKSHHLPTYEEYYTLMKEE